MRDLTSRLREIVRREPSRAPGSQDLDGTVGGGGSGRELTYVPDPDASAPRRAIAAVLGGIDIDETGSCVMVERRYDGSRSHGRRRIESCAPSVDAPIHLFDPRVTGIDDWSRRTVYFDIETTGLSGGAGTVAFLAGCGWFDAGDFVVRQFLLVGPSGEMPMLGALTNVFDEASLLVSFNGRTFDVPFMETRWAFHRSSPPTEDLPHFDMLPPARRLWSRRGLTVPDTITHWSEPESEGCSLTALERRVLGFHRQNDVPGCEIPARYFHFLRTGDARSIEGVLDHNRHDIVSLAVVMSHALWLVHEGPAACREPAELIALGRIYEQAERIDDALDAYERAAAGDDPMVAAHALWRAGVLLRRQKRHHQAASAWQRLVNLPARERRHLGGLVRRAVEALAIHHEHRVRDLDTARRLAGELEASATGRDRIDTERRIRRLDRKRQRCAANAGSILQYDP